jgi:hypothetical protein
MWAKLHQAIMESANGQFRQACLEANNALFGDSTTEHRKSAFSNILDEAGEDMPESEIFSNIRNGIWDTNGDLDHDYPIFMESLRKSRHPAALTWYTKEEYAGAGARLYKVAGFDAGFAIKADGDIVSVHNNTNIRGVAPSMIEKAKELGGDHLDHYDIGRLTKVYSDAGFEQLPDLDDEHKGLYHWDDQFAPDNWDYEKDGRPDVIMRGLPSYLEKWNKQVNH